jgi:hypothetical protein
MKYKTLFLLVIIFLVSCTPQAVTTQTAKKDCMVTQPVWDIPPADPAVGDPPSYGHYFQNTDRSIWVSAWWLDQPVSYLKADQNQIKLGWFRPAGEELTITGQRIDAQADPLEVYIPCCYATQFQPSGLTFPTEGCWEITAKAGGHTLSFIVWVDP